MSLTACRECQQQVSTEAAACPHCGAGHPTGPAAAPDVSELPLFPTAKGGINYSNPLTYLVIIATVAVLAGGYFTYQHFLGGVKASGYQVATTIHERFQSINPKADLSVTCPHTVTLRKDKIVDCSLERNDNGKRTAVFVTGTDNSGHFTMQVEDPTVLIDFP